jgi:integrase
MTQHDVTPKIDTPERPLLTHEDCLAVSPRLVDGKPCVCLAHVSDRLFVQVTPRKRGGASRSWIWRYSLDGKEHNVGLGSLDDVTLDRARGKIANYRDMLDRGECPLTRSREAKQARLKASENAQVTLKMTVERYIDDRKRGWKRDAYLAQWKFQFATYVFPLIGDKPVGAITRDDVLKVIKPHWEDANATMEKIRGRLATVLAYAMEEGWRSWGKNPAVWSNLKSKLADPEDVAPTKNHPALHHRDMRQFMDNLSKDEWIGARALELVILTAARSDEVRRVVWEEINLEARLWVIPASRMKTKKKHRVPLSEPACAILRAIKGDNPNPTGLVFRGKTGNAIAADGIRDAARRAWPGAIHDEDRMLVTNRDGRPVRISAHGFRSTFKGWATSQTSFGYSTTEKALAHKFGSKTARAYDRDDELEKRTELMTMWAKYIGTGLPALKLVASRAA